VEFTGAARLYREASGEENQGQTTTSACAGTKTVVCPLLLLHAMTRRIERGEETAIAIPRQPDAHDLSPVMVGEGANVEVRGLRGFSRSSP